MKLKTKLQLINHKGATFVAPANVIDPRPPNLVIFVTKKSRIEVLRMFVETQYPVWAGDMMRILPVSIDTPYLRLTLHGYLLDLETITTFTTSGVSSYKRCVQIMCPSYMVCHQHIGGLHMSGVSILGVHPLW